MKTLDVLSNSKELKNRSFEAMVADYYSILKDAGYTYSELRQLENSLRKKDSYWKSGDPNHQFTKAQLEATMRTQSLHESGRGKAVHNAAVKELEAEFENLGELSPSKKRQIMQHYGPKPGKDTKKYRDQLPPNIRKLVESELGPEPTDKSPGPFGIYAPDATDEGRQP